MEVPPPLPPLFQSRSRELSHWLNPYVRIMKLLLSGSLLREKSKVLRRGSRPVRWIFLFSFFSFFPLLTNLLLFARAKETSSLWLKLRDVWLSRRVWEFHFFSRFRFPAFSYRRNYNNESNSWSLIFTDLHSHAKDIADNWLLHSYFLWKLDFVICGISTRLIFT